MSLAHVERRSPSRRSSLRLSPVMVLSPLVRLLTSFAIDTHTLAKSTVKPIRKCQKRDLREHIACRARIVDTQASNNVNEMWNHNVRLPNHYS